MKNLLNFRGSVNRPAWSQSSWNTYKHLHLNGRVRRNYFVKDKNSGSRMSSKNNSRG